MSRPAHLPELRTRCCDVESYHDEFDGGDYCAVCDAPVDAHSGRRLTDREHELRLDEGVTS